MFTYTPGGVEPLDRIRFLLQDTTEPADLHDEEILLLYDSLDTTMSVNDRISRTALNAANVLLTRYSKMVTVTADGTTISYSQRADKWRAIVGTLNEIVQPWAQVVQSARRFETVSEYEQNPWINPRLQ